MHGPSLPVEFDGRAFVFSLSMTVDVPGPFHSAALMISPPASPLPSSMSPFVLRRFDRTLYSLIYLLLLLSLSVSLSGSGPISRPTTVYDPSYDML